MEYGERTARLAEPEDLPKVLELFAGAVRRMRESGVDQWDDVYPDRETLRADIEKREMLLLTEEGEPAAAAVVNGEQPPEYAGVAWGVREEEPPAVIHRLCVGAAAQRRGLGRRILLAAERTVLARGHRYIRLDTFTGNPAARRLYESAGYRLAGHVTFCKGLFCCYEKRLGGEEDG